MGLGGLGLFYIAFAKDSTFWLALSELLAV